MKFDDIFQEIGEFGWYQGVVVALIYLPSLFIAMQDMGYVFISAIPQYRCFVDSCDSGATAYYESFLNLTTPIDKSTNTFSECQLYLQLNESFACLNSTFTSQTYECDHWKYDDSVYKSTVVTQFDLVCDDSNLVALSQSIYMVGKMLGGLCFGWIADKFGRKKVLLLTLFICFGTGVGSIYVPYYSIYTTLKFFLGIAVQGITIVVLVMAVEMVGRKPRGPIGMCFNIIYSVGEITFGGLAYGIRDWQWLQLVSSAPFFIFLIYQWTVPESPRWMLLNGHIDDASKILKRVARFNHKEFPEGILNDFQPDDEFRKSNSEIGSSVENASCFDLFRTSYLRFVTLILCFNWFMITVSYYGITMSAPLLGGNEYVNFIIVSSVEIPAYLFGILSMDKIGRRYTMCLCMIVGGIAGICTALVPTTPDFLWLAIVLATIGKFGASGAFGIVYVFTAELYPTVVRYDGLAVASFVGHLGGVIAPYIAALETVNAFLPLVIFGICSFSSGLIALTLPETLGKQLSETLEDCEDAKVCSCPCR